MSEFQSKTIVCALLVNAMGKILLQQRDTSSSRWSEHWSLFGGHVEAGESLEQGLAREILEETGYSLQHQEAFFTFAGKDVKTIHVYLAPIDKRQDELVLGEGKDFGFYSIEDALASLRLTPMARASLEMLASYQRYRHSCHNNLLFNDDGVHPISG